MNIEVDGRGKAKLPPCCLRCKKPRNDQDFSARAWVCRECNRAQQRERRQGVTRAALKAVATERKRLERANKKVAELRSKAKTQEAMAVEYASLPPPPAVECDFETFRYFYLGVEEQHPVTDRLQNVGVTFPFMEPFVAALSDPAQRRICGIWPIRHGKSRILEQYVVYRLCQNPNLRVVVVCGSEQLAKDRVHAIQQVLLDTNRYVALHERWGRWLGKHDEKPWTASEFYIAGRSSGERDPSVRAVGAASNILGTRIDLLILDDIDTPTNSFADRQTIMRNVNTVLRTRLNEGGKVVAIGNRCAPDDVYEILKGRKGWWWQSLSAIQDDGSILCPEMYSEEELKELAEDMTPEEFSLMVLNNPSAEGMGVFTQDIIVKARGEFNLGEVPEGWDVVVGLDPSTAETAACVTVTYNRETREARVIDLEERKAPRHDGLVAMLAKALTRYKPSLVVIEEQGGSHFFSDVPEVMDMVYDSGARLERFKTTGVNKHDPGIGIALVAAEMSRGRLSYAWGNGKDQRVMGQLVREMITYKPHGTVRGNHFDAVMALWFCVNVIHTGRTRKRRGIIDPLFARWSRRAPQDPLLRQYG